MAVRHGFINAPREAVWAALADGHSYAEWVVGTREILAEDDNWPQVGAELEFVAGYGPLKFHDRTIVRVSEPWERLELEIRAGRFGTVRVVFELVPWGEGTVVILDEHPLRGISAGLHGPPAEVVLHLRNRLMLRNLAHVVHGKRQGLSGDPKAGAAGRRARD